MKKIFCAFLCFALLLSVCVVSASAAYGYYCGGSVENFTPVGDCEITWDADAATKLDLNDGDLSDWVAAGYSAVAITPENMVSWVGGSEENPAGGVPEGWGIDAYFIADSDYLYFGFNVTDPDVVLVQGTTDDITGDNTTGDIIQLPIDFDRARGKLYEMDRDLFPSATCPIYSFGPMDIEATPIQINAMYTSSYDRGIMSEANGDGVKGSTALTETGWCAEFAFTWNQLYSDFKDLVYADDWFCDILEGDPFEIGGALYYLNREKGSDTLTWTAVTFSQQAPGVQPNVFWFVTDHGMRLLLEYERGMRINCEGIHIFSCFDGTPPVETEPPTDPVTEVPTEEPTNVPTSAPTEAPTEPPTESGNTAPTEGGCGAVMASVSLLMTLVMASVLVKKKE